MWAIWASFGFPAFCANAPLVERHMAAIAATRRIDMKSSLARPTALPRLLESTPAWMRLGPIRFPVKEFKSSGVFHPFATSKAGTGGALVSRLALKLLHQKFNDGRGENQTFTRKALLAKLLRGPRLSLCAERMLRGGQCDCVSRGMQTRLRRQEQPSRALRWCVRDLNTYGGTHAGFFNFQSSRSLPRIAASAMTIIPTTHRLRATVKNRKMNAFLNFNQSQNGNK